MAEIESHHVEVLPLRVDGGLDRAPAFLLLGQAPYLGASLLGWQSGLYPQRLDDLEHLQVVLQALSSGHRCHRSPLRVVGGQQRVAGASRADRRDLPGEVEGVGHAGVHAHASRRREAVRGIAYQEDPPVAVAVGHLASHLPEARFADLEVGVDADGVRHELAATLGREGLGLHAFRIVGMHVDPGRIEVVGDEDGGLERIEVPEEKAGMLLHDMAEIGLDEDGEVALDVGRPLHPDAERVAYRTARAVAAEDVAAAELEGLAARVVPGFRDDGGFGLRRAEPLDLEVDRRSGVAGRLEEDRLQAMLGDVQGGRRRRRQRLHDALGRAQSETAEHRAGQRVDPEDRALVLPPRRGRDQRPRVDARGPEDLERPGRDDVRLRCRVEAGPALQHPVGHAQPAEEPGTAEADRARPDDQYVDVVPVSSHRSPSSSMR